MTAHPPDGVGPCRRTANDHQYVVSNASVTLLPSSSARWVVADSGSAGAPDSPTTNTCRFASVA